VVDVELRSPIFNEETGQIEWRKRQLIRADGNDVEFFRPVDQPAEEPSLIDIKMNVIDQVTGELISGEDDGETWARNLPYSFRSGDIVAVVLRDDSPPETATPAASGPRPEDIPEIPAPPQVAAHDVAVS
jgi:hypothetical protein